MSSLYVQPCGHSALVGVINKPVDLVYA